MSSQSTESAIRAGNPVPRIDDPPSGAIEAEALLALLERESWDMTITETRPSEPQAPKPRSRGLALTMASFVVVLIVGLSWAVAVRGSDEADPADGVPTTTVAPTTTTVASTTTVPATVAPGDLEVIDEALAAYSEGDVDALLALIAVDARLHEGPETRPNDVLRRDQFRTRAEFAASIGEHFVMGECRFTGVISCDVAMSDDFTRGLELDPASGRMAFEVRGGLITLWRVDKSSADILANRAAIAEFEQWHQTAYPDDPMLHWPSHVAYYWERLRSGVDVTPQRIAEYLEALG